MTDAPKKDESLRDGRYVIVGVLGTGAQGKTFDAVDKREGRPVAIKRFDVGGARSWKDVELAEREARVLASLTHPKLPAYVEHFEEGGVLYLVMEKIEGTPLSTLRKKGPLAEGDVRRLLDDARDVLGYLHSRTPPVIHRDLKPANVLRRPDGSFAFVDFGAVRDRMRLEGGSTVVGTFGYMAPEQFQGRAGPGSDVYALGATALALLTGREPEDLPHKGLAFDLEAALPSTDRGLREALAQMLEPDPDRRARAIPRLDARAPRRPERTPPPSNAPRSRAEVKERVREAKAAAKEAAREARSFAREAKARAREDRRAARAARYEERARGPLPPPVQILFTLGLIVARVAVVVAVRVFVPLLLTLMSIVFGPKLREAARKVGAAADRAGAAIERAMARVQANEVPVDEARIRVDDAEEARVRIEEPVEPEEDEDEEIAPPKRHERR